MNGADWDGRRFGKLFDVQRRRIGRVVYVNRCWHVQLCLFSLLRGRHFLNSNKSQGPSSGCLYPKLARSEGFSASEISVVDFKASAVLSMIGLDGRDLIKGRHG